MSTGTEGVRLLPTDPRDMVPSAVRWARAVEQSVCDVPRAQLPAPSRASLLAVTWVLAARCRLRRPDPGRLHRRRPRGEAGVGVRVWQKRTSWLRERTWLQHGSGGVRDGWQLLAGATGTTS